MITRFELRGLVTALCAVLLGSTAADAQLIHYVRTRATGAGDGTSWADAFVELPPALGVAQSGDQIWVAEGTYTPAAGGLDKTATFVIPSGVGVFGGFAGTEVTLAQSDPANHITTLSGDLLGDDALGPEHSADNSHLILSVEDAVDGTVLDGFVVRGGHNVGFFDESAGGMRVKGGSMLIRHCSFIGNQAATGGLVCGQPGITVVDDCLFLDNIGNEHGAGLFVHAGHVLDLRTSRFFGNVGADYGGGLSVFQADATVHDCLFSGNRTVPTGFGAGGALYAVAGTLTVSNSTFSGNTTSATIPGGGALYVAGQKVTISNCILWGDSAPAAPPGTDEIAGASDVVVDHCLVEGWVGQLPGSDTLGLDPLFVDPDGADGIVGTLDDDLRLQPGSPAIDSGDNTAVPADTYDADCDGDTVESAPLDLRAVKRFENDPDTVDIAGQVPPVIDRGAYEFSRWTNLGHGLGDETSPCLVGSGSWKPGLPLGITITGAKPSASGLLFIGPFAIDAPLKGGVLVPYPLFSNCISTDASGQLTSQGLLPSDAPPGFETFIQAWFVDAAGPKGFTATNAVSGQTP